MVLCLWFAGTCFSVYGLVHKLRFRLLAPCETVKISGMSVCVHVRVFLIECVCVCVFDWSCVHVCMCVHGSLHCTNEIVTLLNLNFICFNFHT